MDARFFALQPEFFDPHGRVRFDERTDYLREVIDRHKAQPSQGLPARRPSLSWDPSVPLERHHGIIHRLTRAVFQMG